MQGLARDGFTEDQVKTALHAANVRLSFRYELLDQYNGFKKHLGNILSASVANNALADIKRTAKFTMTEDSTINFLTDRVKPYCRVWIPSGQDWAEFPQGVFLLTTPPRVADSVGQITREVETYDLLQVLVDDKVTDRYTVEAGTNVIAAVSTILTGAGLTQQNLTPKDKALPTTQDWPPGTTKLSIVNNLLGAINYQSLWMDENGYAIGQPYVSPSDRVSEYTYATDNTSVIYPGVQQSLDLWAVPNSWVLVVSEPDRPVLTSTYTNSNASSPTSTVNRGRTIVDYREYEEAVDQATLDARAERIAYEASQVYEHVQLETGIMPMHSNADVFTLQHTTLGISAKYSETSWEMELKASGRMKHEIRRVVNI